MTKGQRRATSVSCVLIGAAISIAGCGGSTRCDDARACSPGGSSTGGASGSSAGGPSGSGTGGVTDAGTRGTAESGGTSFGVLDGSSGSAGADAHASPDAGADAAPPCDVTKTPDVEACLVASEYAVFVAPVANGDGTLKAPVGTVANAISRARSAGISTVIVCNATYDESVVVRDVTSSLQIFGGFQCPDASTGTAWSPAPQGRPLFAPTTPGPALTIDTVTSRLVIQGVDFAAADATAPSTSSIAARVVASTNIALRHVSVAAGKGADGTTGADGKTGAQGEPQLHNAGLGYYGQDATCTNPPATQRGGIPIDDRFCFSSGGEGGTASSGDGEPGMAGTADFETTTLPSVDNGGLGGTEANPAGTDGTRGRDAEDAPNGKSAPIAGTITRSGFTLASGSDGMYGNTGQGGGGGGAGRGKAGCVGASGGQGGMGGCGGGQGGAGIGGGASIALVSWASTLKLEAVVLTASAGGNGEAGGHAGAGGDGIYGGKGGRGDLANGIAAGGSGGPGGRGGNAGSGSGGTGGPSYALAVHGGEVTKDAAVVLVHGGGGAKGVGGALLGTGANPAPEGTEGDAADEFTVP